MAPFSTRVNRIEPSGIREVFEAAGADAINLGLGQPDFPAPDHVHAAATEAIESGAADGYTANRGIPDLREAIRNKHARDNDLALPEGSVIATAGGSEALHLALEAHVDPGEEVIFPDPGFVSYGALTHIAGGRPIPVELREDLTMDPATVREAITDDTAAFIVNSPANPTGAVQSPADMRAFAEIADDEDVICISDEVYEHIIYDGEHVSPYEFAESDNVILVNACSKTYSMTGWRLGWVVASEERIDRMLRVHQFIQACASAPAQHAATAALTGPQGVVDEMVSTFEHRRDVLLDGLADIGLEVATPSGAFYAMPAVPDGWVEALLERDVVVVPGEAFGAGGKGHARISYAADEASIRSALDAMADVTAELQTP